MFLFQFTERIVDIGSSQNLSHVERLLAFKLAFVSVQSVLNAITVLSIASS